MPICCSCCTALLPPAVHRCECCCTRVWSSTWSSRQWTAALCSARARYTRCACSVCGAVAHRQGPPWFHLGFWQIISRWDHGHATRGFINSVTISQSGSNVRAHFGPHTKPLQNKKKRIAIMFSSSACEVRSVHSERRLSAVLRACRSLSAFLFIQLADIAVRSLVFCLKKSRTPAEKPGQTS